MFPSLHAARLVTAGLAVVSLAAETRAQTLAFPNAEGFGRFATGGRGGDVYIVTNLNNSGDGSLRNGITNRTAGVPRTIVFAVSGTIYLNSTLSINDGDLTIAGQTAPGDGICLANHPIDPSDTSDVIIRFLRSRLGDTADAENDAFNCRYSTDVIIDHCSFSWSIDETATAYDNTNFTMQWCFVTESLRDSVHDKGVHGYGGIWGGLGASFHHNLLAHHDSRNPRLNGARYHGTDGELVDLRNNVIYNWRGNSCYGGEPTDAGVPSRQNLVNNYYKTGPATGSGSIRYRVLNPSSNNSFYGLFHVAGNHTTASSSVSADNWNGGVQGPSSSQQTAMREITPFTVAPVVTQSAVDAYPLVLSHAGCLLPARDTVDSRIAGEVANGTITYHGSKNNLPGIIDSQSDVGGWPVLNSTAPPPDGDSDGMPDAWETARGLNPSDPADRNLTNADGYTNLEIYLNELAAPAFPIPVINDPPEPVTVEAGETFTLEVEAGGNGPLNYQWMRNGEPVPGATAAIYQVPSATPADAGTYHVVVGNDYGTVESGTAEVMMDEIPPSFGAGPSPVSVTVGGSASFSASASGTPPISYQWFRGDRALDGATGESLELSSATLGDAGPYHLVATNAFGSASSPAAVLSISSVAETTRFSTGFASDTLHSGTPAITPTSTNWHVMSSKNATATSVGAATGLDLTMTYTSSGIVDSAARFTETPVGIPSVGDRLTLRVSLETTNVRTLGIGLYQSGGTAPHTGLDDGGLTNGSSALATGGTQTWDGYRFHLDTNGPTLAVEGRPAQPGTTNISQSVIAPGTSSSAPTVVPVASSAANGFLWTDGQDYTLTLTFTRTGAGDFNVDATIHGGTDTEAPALAGIQTTAAAPSGGFDAIAIGYRNRDSATLSHVVIQHVEVTSTEPVVSVSDPYQAFLVSHGLDPLTAGASDEDDEHDGVTTPFEFILGGSPFLPDTGLLPTLSPDGGDWVFRFHEHVDASSAFDVGVEKTTDFDSWIPLLDGVDGVSFDREVFDSTHDAVEVRLPGGGSAFLRLFATPR